MIRSLLILSMTYNLCGLARSAEISRWLNSRKPAARRCAWSDSLCLFYVLRCRTLVNDGFYNDGFCRRSSPFDKIDELHYAW